MNDTELVRKYKNLFLSSDLFLNWSNDLIIKNSLSSQMFVCIFNKNNKNIIGFKISIIREEKDISVYWQGEDDKFFELSDEGFQLSMNTIKEYLKKNGF